MNTVYIHSNKDKHPERMPNLDLILHVQTSNLYVNYFNCKELAHQVTRYKWGLRSIRWILIRVTLWVCASPGGRFVGHTDVTAAQSGNQRACEDTHTRQGFERPRQTTPRENRCIVHQALQSPMTSAPATRTQVLDSSVIILSSELTRMTNMCLYAGAEGKGPILSNC